MNTESKNILAEIQNLNESMEVVRPSLLEKLIVTVNGLDVEISDHYTEAARRRLAEIAPDWDFGLSDAFDAIDQGAAVASAPDRRWNGARG